MKSKGKETGKMKRVIVTDNLSEEGIKKLREFAEVDVELDLSPEELKKRIPNYDAIVIRSGTKVTKEIVEAGSTGRLKVIGRAGVGVDNIAVETATEKGILVVNSPEANTISAAEHTIAMMLSLSRKIPDANVSLKSGKWDRKKYMGVEVNGKILGVVGLGEASERAGDESRCLRSVYNRREGTGSWHFARQFERNAQGRGLYHAPHTADEGHPAPDQREGVRDDEGWRSCDKLCTRGSNR